MAGNPMISRRMLVNFLLVFLIILFTYIGNRYDVKTGYQPDHRISRLKPREVTRIAIQTADHALTLVRVDGAWQIESPISWFANNINVERILDILNSPADSKLPGDEIDLASLGLKFPRAVLRLNDTELSFGETNNIGARRYVLIDDTVHLIADRHLPFLQQGITGLVDRRLIPPAMSMRSLELASVSLTRNESGQWLANEANLTPDQAEKIIANWQTLEARHLQKYDSGNTPSRKLVIGLDNGGKIEFYLMSIAPEVVIARADLGIQYHFDARYYYGLIEPEKTHENETD